MNNITAVIALFSILFGLFLFKKPDMAIELQRKVYAMINWRIEPISMKKELFNTRLMGLFMFSLGVLAITYIIFF